MKLPAIQFYVGDWRKDPGIQSLDYFSRGVWLEILLFMHESKTRGLLLLNDTPPTTEQLAQMLGITPSKTKQTQAKLLANGVASIEQKSGALMCRKMYKLHEVRAKAGRIGGSKAQANIKQRFKQTSSPSFSSSISSSKQELKAGSANFKPHTKRPISKPCFVCDKLFGVDVLNKHIAECTLQFKLQQTKGAV